MKIFPGGLMMDYTFEQYQASADTIRSRLGGFVPEVALVLGCLVRL